MPLIRKGLPEPAAPLAVGDRQLTSDTPSERWSAARAIGGSAAEVAALASALLTETDPTVREAILTSLARSNVPAAVDAVLVHLRSDDAHLRTGALDALRAMSSVVGPRVGELVRDSDPDIRLLACELLRHAPAAEASSLAANILEHDPEVNVCAAVVEVLAEVGGPADRKALSRCAERFPGESFLRFAIQVTIERLSTEERSPRE